MASADGSILIRTKVDTNGIKQGTNAIQSGVGKINNSLLKLGATIATVFSVYKLIEFGKEAVNAASQMTNAMIGLKSIVEGTGNSFAQATSFIESYISDGLVPATNAVTAYKNLLMRGYTTEQIEKVMTALKDSAAFGRQASLSLGDAVQSATEGLKNENSILVDNAGVTKNVAKMWEDYAASIGKTANNLTQQEKIQAEVNGILTETRFQVGDAAKVADTWSGKIAVLTFNWNKFLVLVGGRLIQVLTPAINVINSLLVVAINLGNAMANVFGWQTDVAETAGTTAGYVSDTADSESDLADSTAETNKALKKQLAFFDDINVLSSQSASGASGGTSVGGTTGGGGGVVNTDQTVKQLTDLEKKMLDFLNRIKQAWQTDADFTFLGEEFAKAINAMLADIDWDVIKENSYKAGKAIATFLNGAIKDTDWGLVGKTIGESVNTALSFMYGYVSNFDFKRAGTSFAGLLNSTFATIDWEMAGNTISDGVTGALDFINVAIQNFDWDGVGEGIGTGFASIDFLSIIDGIGQAITTLIFVSIPNFIGGIFDGIAQQLGGYDANATIGKALSQIFKDLFSLKNVSAWFSEASNNFTLAFNGEEVGKNIILGIFNGITAGIGLLLLPFTNFIVNVLELFGIHSPSTLFYDIAMYIIEGMMLGFQDFGGAILEWFDTSLTTLWDTVILPWFSIEKWTMIGQNMQNGIKAGFKGIVGWIVGVLNGIIDSFESMVNFVVDGANVLIDKFNSLPSAVRLGYTASRFSKVEFGNIPIPALAQGAVIPANKEFMAILGDQKSGVNIETPLQTMIDAFNTALNNRGGNNSGTVINLNVDGQTFARLTLDSFMNEMTRQGYDVAVLGG